jgi:RNA polymerase sigma-70 factor, ECF subfamily
MLHEKIDSDLVELFRGGDHAAFSELISRYSEKAHNLAMRITRNQEDTEEVLQDVFVTVFKKIDSFKGESAFSSWLYRITVNTAFMKLRKRKQSATISLEEVTPSVKESWVANRSDAADVNYLCSQHQLRAELDDAVQKLPEEYRIIFILRDVDGLSNQEVSEVLEISVPAVKSRLHRSRLMLRKRLARFYEDYTANTPAAQSEEDMAMFDLAA